MQYSVGDCLRFAAIAVTTKVGVSGQAQLPASWGPDRTTSATSHIAGNNTMQATNDRQRPTRRSDR